MDTPAPAPRKRPPYRTAQVMFAAVECYMFAELTWYVIHGEHLYTAIGEQLSRLRAVVKYRAQVADTLRMIRRLPERGTDSNG